MMKKVSYLTVPLVILALFVSGCSQESPTAASEPEGAPKTDAPAVPSVDEVGSQLTPELIGNPNGNCCPPDFILGPLGFENPADLNGDGLFCRKLIDGRTIIIDNNFPGECIPCPPNCGVGGLYPLPALFCSSDRCDAHKKVNVLTRTHDKTRQPR